MRMIPKTPFAGKFISRLIVGGNPFRGVSHRGHDLDHEMEAYYSVARVKRTLAACEQQGINTLQARGDALGQGIVREYWREGGKMNFIAQTAGDLTDQDAHVRQLVSFGALGVYLDCAWVDAHYINGDLTPVKNLLKTINELGVWAGIGTHYPEVVDLAEDEGWDLDFYSLSLYNLHRASRWRMSVGESEPPEEHFDHDDKYAMFERIQTTGKTCLVFKTLGCGRLCVSPEDTREAFAAAFRNIKPQDAIVVGLFTKYKDEVTEDTRLAAEALSESCLGAGGVV